ncbi:hypothetical protein PLESTM_001376400 [Pleodorina starrii]|nr:hypothetical protein PLESTM_001376400 [Pleodorina starrii]
MASVGTIFKVDLWVWDSDGANASVVRHVQIIKPCAPVSDFDTATYKLCQDVSGRYFCAPLACEPANLMMMPRYRPPPSLALLSDTVYVEYGMIPPYYLGPCEALPATLFAPFCGAFALAKTEYGNGQVYITDLCPSINVLTVLDCDASSARFTSGQTTAATGGSNLGPSSGSCSSCPLDMLHMPGRCPPGTYRYRFSVTQGDTTVEKTLTVHVYTRSSVRGLITPFPPYTNKTAAEEDLAAINATIHALTTASKKSVSDILSDHNALMYRLAVSNVSYSLSSMQIDSSDIELLSLMLKTVKEPEEASIIQMELDVIVHVPSIVHEGPIQDFDAYTQNILWDSAAVISELSTKLDYDLSGWWATGGGMLGGQGLPEVTTISYNTNSSSSSRVYGQDNIASSRETSDNSADFTTWRRNNPISNSRRRSLQTRHDNVLPFSSPVDASLHIIVFELAMDLFGRKGSPALKSEDVHTDSYGGDYSKANTYGSEDGISDNNVTVAESPQLQEPYVPRLMSFRSLLQAPTTDTINNFTVISRANLTEAQVPAPGSLQSLLLSLRAVVSTLESQVSAARRTNLLLLNSVNESMSETAQRAAQEEWNTKMGAELSGLLQAKQAATNKALNGSQLVSVALEATLLAMADQQTALYGTAAELSELVARTESMTARAVYDTMVLEEASGLYEYVWTNCPGVSYSKPQSENVWTFRMANFRQETVNFEAGSGRRGMLTRSFNPTVSRSTNVGSGLGYMPVASEEVLADEYLYGINTSAMLDRKMFQSLHLVGGVMLHVVRRPMDEQGRCVDPRGVFTRLNFDCARHKVPGVKYSTLPGTSSVYSLLTELFGTETNSQHPYGTDPIFLPSSSLYDASLADKVNQYYNTTPGSGEVSVTGAPYSYFAKRLQGYPDGFPVLLPNPLTRQRLSQMMTYLKDSNYLDRYTRRLTAEILALSTELKVFGHVAMTFTWARDGSVKLEFRFTGLPALTYLHTSAGSPASGAESASASHRGSWSTVAAHELVGLMVLTAVFLVVVVVQSAKAMWETRKGDLTKRQIWGRFGDVFFDAVVAGLLLSALATYAWYMVAHASVFSARQHYQVYDSIMTARARWLLPRKANPWDIITDSVQTAKLQSSLTALNLTEPFEASSPGRNLLPDASYDEFDELAGVFAATHGMTRAWTVYGITQAVTLMLLIGRLLSTLAFQGRVGAIVKTLYHTVPPMSHLLLVLAAMTFLLAAMAHLILGAYVSNMSTFTGAVDSTMSLFLGHGVLESFQVLLPPSTEFTFGQRLAATSVMFAQVLLLGFVLINFIISVIVTTFHKVKSRNEPGNNATVWRDLRTVILPDMLAAAKRWSSMATFGLLWRNHQTPLTYRQVKRISRKLNPRGMNMEVQEPKQPPAIQAILLQLREGSRRSQASTAASDVHAAAGIGADAGVTCTSGNSTSAYYYLDFKAVQKLLQACSEWQPKPNQPDLLDSKKDNQVSMKLKQLRSHELGPRLGLDVMSFLSKWLSLYPDQVSAPAPAPDFGVVIGSSVTADSSTGTGVLRRRRSLLSPASLLPSDSVEMIEQCLEPLKPKAPLSRPSQLKPRISTLVPKAPKQPEIDPFVSTAAEVLLARLGVQVASVSTQQSPPSSMTQTARLTASSKRFSWRRQSQQIHPLIAALAAASPDMAASVTTPSASPWRPSIKTSDWMRPERPFASVELAPEEIKGKEARRLRVSVLIDRAKAEAQAKAVEEEKRQAVIDRIMGQLKALQHWSHICATWMVEVKRWQGKVRRQQAVMGAKNMELLSAFKAGVLRKHSLRKAHVRQGGRDHDDSTSQAKPKVIVPARLEALLPILSSGSASSLEATDQDTTDTAVHPLSRGGEPGASSATSVAAMIASAYMEPSLKESCPQQESRHGNTSRVQAAEPTFMVIPSRQSPHMQVRLSGALSPVDLTDPCIPNPAGRTLSPGSGSGASAAWAHSNADSTGHIGSGFGIGTGTKPDEVSRPKSSLPSISLKPSTVSSKRVVTTVAGGALPTKPSNKRASAVTAGSTGNRAQGGLHSGVVDSNKYISNMPTDKMRGKAAAGASTSYSVDKQQATAAGESRAKTNRTVNGNNTSHSTMEATSQVVAVDGVMNASVAIPGKFSRGSAAPTQSKKVLEQPTFWDPRRVRPEFRIGAAGGPVTADGCAGRRASEGNGGSLSAGAGTSIGAGSQHRASEGGAATGGKALSASITMSNQQFLRIFLQFQQLQQQRLQQQQEETEKQKQQQTQQEQEQQKLQKQQKQLELEVNQLQQQVQQLLTSTTTTGAGRTTKVDHA